MWKLSQEPRASDDPSDAVMIKASLVPPSQKRVRSVSTGTPPTPTPEEIQLVRTDRLRFNQEVLKYYKTRGAKRRSTLIFSKDVQYVHDLVKMFNDSDVHARAVVGTTPKIARQDNIESFKRGEFPVLVTCLALSEGLDVPQVSLLLSSLHLR